MILNPLFGLTGEPSASSGPSLVDDDVSSSPFQEILHSVQQAESTGSGPLGSGYPSLADLIDDVVSAATSQNPGLERNASDHPRQGSAIAHTTASEDPIEPGLSNGFTRVAPQLQTSSGTAEGPLGLNNEVDPAAQSSTNQTELPFVEATSNSDNDVQPKQFAHPTPPQPNTIGNVAQAASGTPGSDEGTDRYDSETVPASRGLDRDSQWTVDPPNNAAVFSAVPDDSVQVVATNGLGVEHQVSPEDTSSSGLPGRSQQLSLIDFQEQTESSDESAVWGRDSSPVPGSASRAPETDDRTPLDPEASGRPDTSAPTGHAPGETRSFVSQQTDRKPPAAFGQGESPLPHTMVNTFGSEPEANSTSSGAHSTSHEPTSGSHGPGFALPSAVSGSQYASSEAQDVSPEPSNVSLGADETTYKAVHNPTASQTKSGSDPGLFAQQNVSPGRQTAGAPVRDDRWQHDSEAGAEHAQLTHEPSVDGRIAERVNATLGSIGSPELAQDIATTLSAQQTIQKGEAPEKAARVADLLRSMDGLTERLDTPEQARPEGLTVLSGRSDTQRQEFQGKSFPNTSSATVHGNQQESGQEGLELDDSGLVRQPLAPEASRVDRQEKVDTSRLYDGLNRSEGPFDEGSENRPGILDRASVLNAGSASVKHQPEAEVPLQNLMPSDRQDAPSISSTPPDSGPIPNIGVVRGTQEPIGSLDVSDQPAPPTDVDEPKVTNQIVRGARFLTREGANQVTLRLDPPELGEVTIRLTSSGNTLSGEIRVESRMVQELVSRNIGELRESLGNQGIHVNNIEVSVESGGRSSVDRDGSAPSQRERADRESQSESDRDRQPQEQDDQREQAARRSTGDGNVDYVA